MRVLDIKRVAALLKECNFEGVVIPDHASQISCSALWHTGMAYAMGYLKAVLD